jgi:PTH1 family peptidyl-tRNA hydrolase
MKYLIVGLGNIGQEYKNTRHNIGFTILDQLTKDNNVSFEQRQYASVAKMRYKGRLLDAKRKNTTFSRSYYR